MNSLHTSESYGTREEFAEALLDYINTKLPLVHPKAAGHEPFERSTPLFEVGGIDSLSIVHIVTSWKRPWEAPCLFRTLT